MKKLYARIKEMIEILRDEDLDEIEVRSFFTSIRVARRRVRAASQVQEGDVEDAVPVSKTDAGSAQAAQAVEPVSERPAEAAPGHGSGIDEILSPMVGTFYRSAKPGADPFISEGSRVEVGQVLCIIEAMKLMNEIEAEKSGVIRKILVKDSQPVEFGQPLFLVESA